jgi:hypothetical protein
MDGRMDDYLGCVVRVQPLRFIVTCSQVMWLEGEGDRGGRKSDEGDEGEANAYYGSVTWT